MNDGVDQQQRRGGEKSSRLLSLLVKRNKDRYEFDVDWDSSTVEDVFTAISEKSNALKRTMKLIVGGQTMTASDDGKKIFSEAVAKKIKGNKVTCMLLDGSNATTRTTTTTKTVSAGAAMASSMAEKRRREAMEKMIERKSKVTAEKSSTTILNEKRSGSFGGVWEKTGICSSHNSGLDALPIAALEALNAEAKIKVFDFSSNAIARVPSVVFTLPALRNITRISLCNNIIESAGFDFKMLFANFKFLKYLDLSNNNLSGAMEITSNSSAAEEEGEEENEEVKTRSPLQLKISNNRITSFSSSFFKACPPLQSFDASGNQICDSIAHYFVGSETTLTHVNLASNARVSAIPNEFRNMKSLQSLILDGNRIDKKGIPAVVLRECERLSELSLKQNQVTIEELRELDGWDAYNERRVSRADKILDAKTMLGDASFREGADAERYTRDF